ncbi:elongation factor P [Egibacter rhizosphaerae]|uniref:Elongation factor P n=1 Tax=Egibacter rhizosphaerae TaxID=1670831 RepID=A0A411YK00_9ACTN|nr:elongation factor P [Egibacter rhizosphaerae]QBI21532.1 elongation factor P [Egibacter rhizosphaerae]
MVSTNNLKNGMTLVVDGEIWRVDSFQHVKPGKGGAFVRTTLKNVRNGKTLDKRFRADEQVEQAILERRQLQFLYREGTQLVFMDTETFDQSPVEESRLGDATRWIRDGDSVELVFHEGQVIDVNLPASIEVEVTESEPGHAGDRVSGATKPATVETGAVVQVPLFIEPGDRVKVDTRDGSYLSRT